MAIFITAVLSSFLAFALFLMPQANGTVVCQRHGKLFRAPTWITEKPRPAENEEEAEDWSTPPIIQTDRDGGLNILLSMDVMTVKGPRYYTLEVWQSADGTITAEIDRTDMAFTGVVQCFSAARYADIASEGTVVGRSIGELLAVVAGGTPPVDLDVLKPYIVSDRQPISKEVRAALHLADSPDWRTRERAAVVLRQHLPELRTARAEMDLTPEQSLAVDAVLGWPESGDAAIGAAVWELRH